VAKIGLKPVHQWSKMRSIAKPLMPQGRSIKKASSHQRDFFSGGTMRRDRQLTFFWGCRCQYGVKHNLHLKMLAGVSASNQWT
jgi:hypothetical protein